jgi:N-acetylneuraminate synthase
MAEAKKVLIIAEAGVNHNGSLDTAVRLVDAAAAAGADVVKFQSFRADALATASAGMAPYQKARAAAPGSQADMLRRLELPQDAHRVLAAHCRNRGIEFLSTAFDEDYLEFLVREIGVARIKVASGEITNGPFLLAAARLDRPIVLSTGMSTLADVEAALGVLAFGLTDDKARPGGESFRSALASPQGKSAVRERVTLLHCVTAYPAPLADANLRAMNTLGKVFGTPIGYSDHTPGIVASLAAVALGATVIEKHLTLDRTMEGPDHHASLEPKEFEALARGVREIGIALGSAEKHPVPSEEPNRLVARKSLVAARFIARGATITLADLAAKRPASGVSPMDAWSLVGTKAMRDYAIDELIER